MTVTIFIGLVTAFSVITSLCTEAFKKVLTDAGVHYSANVVASTVAAVIGVLGTCAYYVLFSIQFTAANIVCIFLLSLATAVGSMVGYDKVIQTISQIASMKAKN